jgi:integrase
VAPRKASLRVAHQTKCAHANSTSVESLNGCTCKQPAYYVLWRDSSGATCKSARVRDRRVAEKVLRKKQVEIDKGNVDYQERRSIAFPEWADEYEAILEARPGIKPATRRGYAGTLRLAREAIGYVELRKIGPPELRGFHARMKALAPATQVRHLKHLGACLSAALDEGYLERNPLPGFKKSLRLRVAAGTPPYTDGELAALVVAVANPDPVTDDGERRPAEPVYPMVVRAAATTGARIGELVALDWTDVKLADGTLRIRHTYDPVAGTKVAPKDNDERTVYLTPEAQQVFAEWVREAGVHDSGLVFPAPRSKAFLNVDYVRKLVNVALTQAGVPKVDPMSGRPRKPFHSLRATFARQQLEQGKNPQWVERQLGHSSLQLTVNVYGAWSDEAMRAEAAKSAQRVEA